MGDASLEEYPCSKERGDCGNKYFAWVYFYSFTIVGHFILLNLFLAVVLENFGKDEGSTETTITDQDFATFFSLWHKYDRDGEGFINFSDLNRFLQELPPPLGMGQKASRIRLLQLHRKYNMNVFYTSSDEYYCHYVDVLHSLTSAVYGISPDELPAEVKEGIERQLERTKSKWLVDSQRKLEKKRRTSERGNTTSPLYKLKQVSELGIQDLVVFHHR